MPLKMRKLWDRTTPLDHRYAIVAAVYVILALWAVRGHDVALAGLNGFLRARSPQKAMLYLQSQQALEAAKSQPSKENK